MTTQIADQEKTEWVYLALVSTPGIFANAIRKALNHDYVHVTLSLDADFKHAFSFGRRDPSVPIFAGFTRENASEILGQYPGARYRIVSIPCTKAQKNLLQRDFRRYYKNRFHYHYNILGLPFIVMNKPFYLKNRYTCSSFLAMLLDRRGIMSFDKHFSLVTPRDFYEGLQKTVVFEGYLHEYPLLKASSLS
ncbi:MAG: hypothetical protein ACOYD7_05335 [Raoultibacter sp.]|jgi:hypothetical protein